MWILVYIVINPLVPGNAMSLEPVATNAMGPRYTFNTMTECFFKREELSVTVGGNDGYFPEGKQAVCVYIGEKHGI